MERGYYQLEASPQFAEQIERLLNTDEVRAEDSFFEALLLRMLNNDKALKLLIDAVRVVADAALPASQKGQPGGVASLGANGKLVQMPAAADVGARPANWTPTAADVGAVPTSRKINGKALSADVSLAKGDVGLGSVDNTADSAKRVSYAATAGSAPANGGNADTVDGKHATDFLALAGGTMTGSLRFKRGTWSGEPIRLIEGDANGSALLLQAGGMMLVGSGEASNSLFGALGQAAGTEHLHLCSDGPVYLHTNCQTIANRKTVTIDNNAKITAPGGFGGNLAGTANAANACNGLTFVVAAAVSGVTNNRVTFVY